MKPKTADEMTRIIVTCLVVLIITAKGFGQAPEKISYQAVIRDAGNVLVANQEIGMRISILQGSDNGIAVYTETQNPMTNGNGLVSIDIGTGNSADLFSEIDWTVGTYFLKTETDPAGGTIYTITGISQLLSVPYALHSKTAESLTGIITESQTLADVTALGNSVNSQIKNLSDPTDPQDAATKDYVDQIRKQIEELEYSIGSRIKDVEGNSYKTIRLGDQVWMAENLRTTKYADGTPVAKITSNEEWLGLISGAYAWYNNDSLTYSNSYGALYNWYAVESNKICPVGWRVPGDYEWEILASYLIQNGFNYDGTTTGNKIAKSLAASTHWVYSSTEGSPGNTDYPLFRNKSWFTALPGGLRSASTANFLSFGLQSFWWTMSGFDTNNALCSIMTSSREYLEIQNLRSKKTGMSIRCMKN